MSPYADKPWLKHYDFWVPATANYPRRSLYQLLMLASSQYRNRPATLFQDQELTFGEIKSLADRLATALAARGISKGDRVGLMLPNSPQYMIAFFALMRLGATVANFNPLYTPAEVERQARDAGLAAMLTLDSLVGTARSCGEVFTTPLEECFPDLIESVRELRLPSVEIDPENDIAVLQYTGGTTGVSKAAMLTHYNLYANAIQVYLWNKYLTRQGQERMLLVIPYYHVYALSIGMLLSCWNGTLQILLPKFDIDALVAAFRDYHPTAFPGVPTLYIALLHHPEARNCGLENVRRYGSGSAPLPVEVIEQFEQMTGAVLGEGYGLTEASPSTHGTPAFGRRKPGSVGLPLTDTESRIVDVETGERELPMGEEGELCIRGPQIMKGYWAQPEETANTLRDGWLYTGDVARMDEDGYFWIVQRKKDMISVGGLKVYPTEVEEVLFQHPGVLEAAVVGVAHSYRGEDVKAFIVLKDGARAEAAEIGTFCRQRLAPYKIPREFEFLDELPKSGVGKVLRRALRDMEKEKVKA